MKRTEPIRRQEQAAADSSQFACRSVLRFRSGVAYACRDSVIEERRFDLHVDGRCASSFTCSPWHVDELALGRLYLEGSIASIEDVRALSVDYDCGRVDARLVHARAAEEPAQRFARGRVISFERIRDLAEQGASEGSGGGSGSPGVPTLARVSSGVRIAAADVCRGIAAFERSSDLFHRTGGVHAAALVDAQGVVARREDIGRHSAMDKLVGWCVKNRVSARDKLVMFSGRVPQEIICKVIRLGCPAIVSPGAPTSLSVDLAEEYGVTLIGFAKADRFNVYSHAERVAGAEIMAL